MRTFIAIDLDEIVKSRVQDLIRQLQTTGSGVKWVKPQGMHLTLKFLGEISQERASGVRTALECLSGKLSRFSLTFRGTGMFPPKSRRPRVLWLGLDDSGPLQALREDLERDLEKLGFPRETRAFHPHLTLGRIKSPQPLSSTLELLKKQETSEFGSMEVEKIMFFQSVLKPQGAEYTVLSEAYLS